ncbi:MAG: histidine kinase, partial [Ferruginibacter sp.]
DCDSATSYEDRVIDRTRLAYLYNVRADIYWHLKQYELNGEYVDKALAIHLASKNYRMVGQAYADKGDLFVIKKQIEKGIEYYKKAIHIGDSVNDKRNLSRYHCLLSETYLDIKKTSEALTEATAALKYAKEEDNPVQEAYVYTLLCKIFNQQHNLPAAISNGRLGHYMAIQEIDLPLQQSSAAALAVAFKSAGNVDSAYHYLQVSKDLNDSLITKNFNQETANLQVSFDVSQKEKQIELLAKDKELQQQKLKQQSNYIIASVVVAMLALMGVWLAVNRYRLRQRMKELELRNQIAADLHDEVGSSLSSIHMLSQMAAQPGNEATHRDILSRMSTNAKETMDKMGDIVWMIKPGETEAGGLKQRMERFAYEICSSKNIEVNMQLEDLEKTKLSMEQRKNIYLIFKEALNNAVKYSGTEKIEITSTLQNNQLTLQVKDFGKGFDSSIVKKGNGLDNMQHRAKELNGSVGVIADAGTMIELQLPV